MWRASAAGGEAVRRVNLLHAHGSPKRYLYHQGCRCVACRAANTESQRQYRAENPEKRAEYNRKHPEKLAEYKRTHRAAHPGQDAEQGRKYRAGHKEEIAAYDRKYRAAHKEEIADYHRKYYAKHPEECAERSRKYYAEHTKEIAEYDRRYDAAHPEAIAARNHNRRALEANATGTHTGADVKAQYERQHGKCLWRNVNPACDVSLKNGYHVDHVIPLGGNRTSSNGPENIVLSCPKCNRSKGAKDPMDWAGVMF